MIIQRKRVAKRLASGLLAGAVAFGGLAISGSSPAGALPVELDANQRVGGADRYATAALVSQELEDAVNADTEAVIIANGDNFPDALTAASLSDETPILLVKSDSIPSATRDRLGRLADSVVDVYVIGGTSAVSEAVFADIEAIMDEADVTRLSGANRYATAVAVAEETGLDNGVFALVSGENYADAVTVGSWSSATGTPILLANSSGIPSETSAALETAIDEDSSTRVIIVGGPSAVSGDAEADLLDMGFKPSNITRVAGSDRYMTNLMWQLEHFGGALGTAKYLNSADQLDLKGLSATLVSGTNFPDALAAAPLAAYLDSHLVLVNPVGIGAGALTLAGAGKSALVVDKLEGVAAALTDAILDLTDNSISTGEDFERASGARTFGDLWVVGGTSAVPDSVITGLAAAADSKVSCSFSVSGFNDDNTNDIDGVVSGTLAFSTDLSVGAWITTGDKGEKPYVNTNIGDLVRSGRSDISAAVVTWLDLNGNGASDAVALTFDTLTEGDTVNFLGLEAEDADYATTSALDTGAGLRELEACSATIGRDRTAPTISVKAVDGGTLAYVSFSETLGITDAAIKGSLEDDLGKMTTSNATDTVECTKFTADNTQWSCEIDESPATNFWVEDQGTAIAADSYIDQAGNGNAALTTTTGPKATASEEVANPGLSVSADCRTVEKLAPSLSTVGFISDKWNTLTGASPTGDVNARVDVPTEEGRSLRIPRGSAIAKDDQNDWTFEVTHVRGTMTPSVAVDGTDVTVTIDRYVHDVADIAAAINKSSVGTGGLAASWTASAAASADANDLIDPDDLDVPFGSIDGVTGTQSCLITITTSAAMHLEEMAAESSVSAVDTAGEFTIRVDGAYQTPTCDAYGAGDDVSKKLYCLVDGISDFGTVRVDMMTQYVDDDASKGLKFATA